MPRSVDGPASPYFSTISYQKSTSEGDCSIDKLSSEFQDFLSVAPEGDVVGWGIPFDTAERIVTCGGSTTIEVSPTRASWLLFLHAADFAKPSNAPDSDLIRDRSAFTKRPPIPIGQAVARYTILYADGESVTINIRQRYEIGPFSRNWGELSFSSVAHQKPASLMSRGADLIPADMWGMSQWRTFMPGTSGRMANIWAWENPKPGIEVVALKIDRVETGLVLLGISGGNVTSNPLRWEKRKKAVLVLADQERFTPSLADHGTEGSQIQGLIGGSSLVKLDLGQVASVSKRPYFDQERWDDGSCQTEVDYFKDQVVVEYSAHPDAHFHLSGGDTFPVASIQGESDVSIRMVTAATAEVHITIVDKKTGARQAARVHVHGESGEYLTPVSRDRVPNDSMCHMSPSGGNLCLPGGLTYAYVNGSALYMLPLGKVYIEVVRGFEIKPIRKSFLIEPGTDEIKIELVGTSNWREKGWVTADTHVHYLSPSSALIEAEAEGVNVINLLASQFGESFPNVTDFDGQTVFGSKEAGGKGEYLVRVGTENRQPILGHLSLLGYEGELIEPISTGGPCESAIGDPVNNLMSEWAERCQAQNGLVVIPHYPYPRGEQPVLILGGLVDAVELSFPSDLDKGGLDPYAIIDWYRFLNCGYNVPAVGGTDKMSQSTAVGAARTYTHIPTDEEFTYDLWKTAVRDGHTFVTLGPLIDFCVDGKRPGQKIKMPVGGGTVDIEWAAESVVVDMVKVELILNGDIVNSETVDCSTASGSWQVKIDKNSWLAILVRSVSRKTGDSVIGAHSSAITIEVENSAFISPKDATSILEQIEGSMAYLDTIATTGDVSRHHKMRLYLTSVHRQMHNLMHQQGVYHDHSAVNHHEDHDSN